MCQFTLLISTAKGNKVGGLCSIDLAKYIEAKKISFSEVFKFEKCPDKNAALYLHFEIQLLGELQPD